MNEKVKILTKFSKVRSVQALAKVLNEYILQVDKTAPVTTVRSLDDFKTSIGVDNLDISNRTSKGDRFLTHPIFMSEVYALVAEDYDEHSPSYIHETVLPDGRFSRILTNKNTKSTKKPIKESSIRYYANPNWSEKKRYRLMEVPKKSGGSRQIHIPAKGLKFILSSLNELMSEIAEPHIHEKAKGFRKGSSIVTNAEPHTGKEFVLNLDLSNFFHSITLYRVKAIFKLPPFSMREDNQEYIRYILASLCTHSIRTGEEDATERVLPQGAPTSPLLSNLVCRKLDRRLSHLAKHWNVEYTRYADDITFSSDYYCFNSNKPFMEKVFSIIEDEGFNLNMKKYRLQKPERKQMVTGLTVNEKVNVSKSYIKELRRWVYYWERYGYEKANAFWKKKNSSELSNVLNGKIAFVQSVKGNNSLVLKLKLRMNLLTSPENSSLIDKYRNEIAELNNSALPEKESGSYPSDFAKEVMATSELDHAPRDLVKALKEFATNETLKYVTHDWDENLLDRYSSLSEFIDDVRREWNSKEKGQSLSDRLFKLRSRLKTKIDWFMFKETLGERDQKGKLIYWGWGSAVIQVGWSSQCFEDQFDGKLTPWNLELPQVKVIEYSFRHGAKPKSIIKFGSVIQILKNEIEFRLDEEGRTFFSAVKEGLSTLKGEINFAPYAKKLRGVSFYCDVEYVIIAIRKIADMMKGFKSFSTGRIDCENSADSVELRIVHLDSVCDRTHDDPKMNGLGGDLKRLINDLRNVCDLSIEAEFIDGTYRIHYLKDGSKHSPIYEKHPGEIEGFTYVLKFYKR